MTITLVFAVEGLASLNVNQEQPERAARLFAWADVMREKIGDHRPPVEQASVDRDLAVIRSQLDDAAFKQAYRTGQAMTTEQVIELRDEPGRRNMSKSTARVIRTPDQRLRVFVSSTLQEVADERKAAREAIEHLRLAPVMFELGARPHPPKDLYRAYLDQSDIFVGIYWQKYGWVAPDMDISGLEDEYRLSGDKPKLIYIKAPAPDREPRLKELLDRIRTDDRVSYKSFSTAG